jgi:hypothetical protein
MNRAICFSELKFKTEAKSFLMESGRQSTIYISFDKQPVVYEIVFAVGPLSPVIMQNLIPAFL